MVPCRRCQARAPVRPARPPCRLRLARRAGGNQREPEGCAVGGLARRLSGHAAAGSRRHGALDAVSALSVPRWGSQPHPGGAGVREPGSGPVQRPNRAVAAGLQLLPQVGLGVDGSLALKASCTRIIPDVVQVRKRDNSELHVKIKRSLPMCKLFSVYCKRRGLDRVGAVFFPRRVHRARRRRQRRIDREGGHGGD